MNIMTITALVLFTGAALTAPLIVRSHMHDSILTLVQQSEQQSDDQSLMRKREHWRKWSRTASGEQP